MTAGGTGVVEVPLSNPGETDSPPQAVTLQLPTGVQVSSAQLNDSAPALRAVRSTFATVQFADICAAPQPGQAVCNIPALAAGSAKTLSIELAVSPDAEDGTVDIELNGNSLGRSPFVIGPGYAAISMTVSGAAAAKAGQNVALNLTARAASGVTNPGPVTLSTALSDKLLITAVGEGCEFTIDHAAVVCRPSTDGLISAQVTAAVLPLASGVLPEWLAALPGGRHLPLDLTDPKLTVEFRNAADPMLLTGRFGAAAVGAATHQCTTAGPTRQQCSQVGDFVEKPLTPTAGLPAPAIRTITIPAGATVVNATLGWAATGAKPGEHVSTVRLTTQDVSTGTSTVSVDADQEVANTATGGAAITLKSADITELFQRTGSIDVQVQISSAITTVSGSTPMAGWTLTVIWTDPALDTDTTVAWSFTGEPSLSGAANSTVPLIAAGSKLQALWATVFASDPWAVKQITTGGAGLTGFNGREPVGAGFDGPDNGYTLVSAAPGANNDPLAASAGVPIEFHNETDQSARQDQVWIGPVLAVRNAH